MFSALTFFLVATYVMRPLVSDTADVVNEIQLDIHQDEPQTPA